LLYCWVITLFLVLQLMGELLIRFLSGNLCFLRMITLIFNIEKRCPNYGTLKSFSSGLFVKEVIPTIPPEGTCVDFSRVSPECESYCVMAVTALVVFHCLNSIVLSGTINNLSFFKSLI